MPDERPSGAAEAGTAAAASAERFNALTHLVGAALALAGTVVLVSLAVQRRDSWRIVSFAVYGAVLVAQYVSSFLYHSARGPAKATLRNLDHCAIYLLIAGTYTPFTLVTLRDNWGWPLFCAIWALAAAGLVQEIWFSQRARAGAAKLNRLASLAIYLVMGWLALLALVPLVTNLTYRGFGWIAAGGLLYTGGVYFYVAHKKGMRHGHGIWHLFVLGGSACHYLAVLLFVA
jgi:hemolysin III